MEDGISYAKQIIFHSQTQIVFNNGVFGFQGIFQVWSEFGSVLFGFFLGDAVRQNIIKIAVACLEHFSPEKNFKLPLEANKKSRKYLYWF